MGSCSEQTRDSGISGVRKVGPPEIRRCFLRHVFGQDPEPILRNQGFFLEIFGNDRKRPKNEVGARGEL